MSADNDGSIGSAERRAFADNDDENGVDDESEEQDLPEQIRDDKRERL